MHRSTAVVIALSLVVAGIGVATGPAAAQSDDGDFLDTLTGDADGPVEAVVNAGDFLYGMAVGEASALVADDPDYDSFQVALDLRNDINGNDDAYQQWLNDRVDASETRNVVQVTVKGPQAENQSRFWIISDVQNGTYQNLGATGSTNRTIDESCTLSGRAAENAHEELETFRAEYVQPNESVDQSYMGRLAAEYDGVSCTFIGGGS